MRLFKMIELEEGVPVQFLAVYALHWRPEWGEPEYGFIEVGCTDVLLSAIVGVAEGHHGPDVPVDQFETAITQWEEEVRL